MNLSIGSSLPSVAAVSQHAAETRALAAALRTLQSTAHPGENWKYQLSFDPQTKRPVVQIVDRTSLEVLEQLPSKSVLDFAHQLNREHASNI